MSFLDDYEPVEDRLRQFWTEHPYGRVITELLHHSDGDYIVVASVYFGNELRNDPPTTTGLAHDSAAQLPANMKASALEVCETSAIGRALANAGYAAKGKRPSREEMQKNSAGSKGALPSRPAEPRPEPVDRGEGSAGSGDTSGAGGSVSPGESGAGDQLSSRGDAPASPAPAPEPHEHVKGKQLASGSWLCSFEIAPGRICGAKFKPRPKVHTAPITEDEVRKDIA